MTAATQLPRSYDLIGFGDEVPGILALVAAAREFRRQTGKLPRSLLMFKGDSRVGVGGLLVRGGLAYLDRTHIPLEVKQSLGLQTFGDPASLYKEFLQRSQVKQIALDPRLADAALRQLLSESGVDLISRVQVKSVLRDGPMLAGIRLTNNQMYLGSQFIDSTVNAELAQMAGVQKLRGFGTFGLPESELPVTLVFETEGLKVDRLKQIELDYLKRLTNPNDSEAQRYIQIAAGNDAKFAAQLRQGLTDDRGNLNTMSVGIDHIDLRCRALSILYHAFRGSKLALQESGMILDQANIAILPGGRLSWNALLCAVTGSQAEVLARNAAKPTPDILQELGFIDRFFKSLGATAVRPAAELYIRHAGNVLGVVEPLSGAKMLAGAIPASQALATFGYHLDVRGGIAGLGPRAMQCGLSSISFHTPPLFNVGIQHALVQAIPNLAIVSPGSGFDGYACSAGRIVEFNVAVGQGVGIAASLALLSGRNLATIANPEVRQVLEQTGQLPQIYGRSYMSEAIRLQEFEQTLLA
jgi:FAD dependent oxidoreductase